MTWERIEHLDDDRILSQTYALNDVLQRQIRFSLMVVRGGESLALEIEERQWNSQTWAKLVSPTFRKDVLHCLFQFVAWAQVKWGESLPLTLFSSTFSTGSVGDLWTLVETMLDNGQEMLGAYWTTRNPETAEFVLPVQPRWTEDAYITAVRTSRLGEWEKVFRRNVRLSFTSAQVTETVLQVWQVRNGG